MEIVKMDLLFQILLTELPVLLGLELKTYVLEEVHYVTEPRTYRWGKYVEIVATDFHERGLFELMSSEYHWLKWYSFDIKGEGILLLEKEINDNAEIDWGGFRLDDLLETLMTTSEHWAICFIPRYEILNEVQQMSIQDCLSKLKHNLNFQNPQEGFVAYGDGKKTIVSFNPG